MRPVSVVCLLSPCHLFCHSARTIAAKAIHLNFVLLLDLELVGRTDGLLVVIRSRLRICRTYIVTGIVGVASFCACARVYYNLL